MPRKARILSSSGFYHITIRGINRQQIFEDSTDFLSFLLCLKKAIKEHPINLHAYCLMSNHVHLLLESPDQSPAHFMKSLEGSFVYHYNKKYDRCGILFQNRFYSKIIDNETAFFAVLRYIHQNPMRAGLEKVPGTYPWSSYYGYFHPEKDSFLCRDFVISHFVTENNLIDYLQTPASASDILHCRINHIPEDPLVIRAICELSDCHTLNEARQLPINKRNQVIVQLHDLHISYCVIARMFGISKTQIGRILTGK